MKRRKCSTGREHITISDADLLPASQLGTSQPGYVLSNTGSASATTLVVSLEDLHRSERERLIRIDPEDLAAVDQQILSIDEGDLPEIVRIGLRDLPPDLSFMATECYHGTSWAAAERIRREGFRVGSGMASGSGVYFAVGAVGCAKGYAKSGSPCIVRARVRWGRVAYLDDPQISSSLKQGGVKATEAALGQGYESFILSRRFSSSAPTIGIVLASVGTYVKSPRIEVIELIDPRATGRRR